MIFAIYKQRRKPYSVIFDFEIHDPPEGQAQHYDCAGVFSLPVNATRYLREDGTASIGVSAHWSLRPASDVLTGDYRAAGRRVPWIQVPLTRLWTARGGVSRRHPGIALTVPRIISMGRPSEWD